MARPRNTQNPRVKAEWLATSHALLRARQGAGLTQVQLAQQLGIGVSTLAHYELGTRPVPHERLRAIARLLSAPELVERPALLSTASRSKVPKGDYSDDEVFNTTHFAVWWAQQFAAFGPKVLLTLRDEEDARRRLIAMTRELLAIRNLDAVSCPAEEAEALALAVIPAIVAAYQALRIAEAA